MGIHDDIVRENIPNLLQFDFIDENFPMRFLNESRAILYFKCTNTL